MEKEIKKEKGGAWKHFLTNVGQGIAMALLVLSIIMLYRGCNDKPSLLPLLFPQQTSK